MTDPLLEALIEIRDRLDVGGEQSRAFAEEIKIAEDAIAEAEKPSTQQVCATCQEPESEHGDIELVGALCPGQREDFDVFMPKAEGDSRVEQWYNTDDQEEDSA